MHKLVLSVLLLPCVVSAGAARGQDRSPDDPIASSLKQSSVYVGRSLWTPVDVAALRELAAKQPAGLPLKMAIVNKLPKSGSRYKTRDGYTHALHSYLELGKGILLIETRKGVSASSEGLPPEQISTILGANAQLLKSDPTQGIERAIESMDAAIAGSQPTSRVPVASTGQSGAAGGGPATPAAAPTADYWWLLPVGLGAGALILLGRKGAQKARELRDARIPVDRLRGEVVNGIAYADTYLDLLPASSEASAAQQSRQEAARLLDQGLATARAARSAADYGRAQALLEQAKQHTDAAHKSIDIATGGTGVAVGIEGTDYRATPIGANGVQASQSAPVVPGLRAGDIPAGERGACFFCSRPSRISDLTPVSITLNGQRRKVLACQQDVQTIQTGSAPEVRTVSHQGRPVPWYRSAGYDPYRDYERTQVFYTPVYGGYNYASGLEDGFLYGALLSDPMPVPYPVFLSPAGVPTADFFQAAPPPDPAYFVPDAGQDTAGIDFGSSAQDTGGVDFGSSAQDTGGVDFGSSAQDTGGVDFGSGGQDTGGDFSGGDTAGTDFGGGSDFSGSGDASGGGDTGGSDF